MTPPAAAGGREDMMQFRLLDLFCGAGGAAKGYHRAGFYVVGVDHFPQPHYCGDEFHQADAMTYPLDGFDAIHASPPCQRYSCETPPTKRDDHPDLIDATRGRLVAQGVPWVIENVPGAKGVLFASLVLCGSMFDLPIRRHRLFETSLLIFPPQCCHHLPLPVVPTGTTRRKSGRLEYPVQVCREAMGIDWMTRKELDEAIPPVYCEYIGSWLIKLLQGSTAT